MCNDLTSLVNRRTSVSGDHLNKRHILLLVQIVSNSSMLFWWTFCKIFALQTVQWKEGEFFKTECFFYSFLKISQINRLEQFKFKLKHAGKYILPSNKKVLGTPWFDRKSYDLRRYFLDTTISRVVLIQKYVIGQTSVSGE